MTLQRETISVPRATQTHPRWVAFDAVGTLIYPNPPVRTAYYRIAQRFGSQLSEATIGDRFREAYLQLEESAPSGLITSESIEEAKWKEIVARVISDVSDPTGCFSELYDWFANPQAWSVFPDVVPALSRLAQAGLGVSIASNFDSRLHRVCDGLSELSGITQRIVSSEVGFRKPAREFFAAVAKSAAVSESHLVMVGDSYTSDVAGAENAGMRAVWIDRKHATRVDRVASLGEAVERILGSSFQPLDL